MYRSLDTEGGGGCGGCPRSHCPKFNDPYNFEEAFQGSASYPASEKEWSNLGTNLEENSEVTEAHLCQIEG